MASRIIGIGGVIILVIGLIPLFYGIFIGISSNWSSTMALAWVMYIVLGSILTFIGFVITLYYLIKR